MSNFASAEKFISQLTEAGAARKTGTTQPESLEQRVFGLLARATLSKSEISSALGQKNISGQLNQVIRVVLTDQTLEYTIPRKTGQPLAKISHHREGCDYIGITEKR